MGVIRSRGGATTGKRPTAQLTGGHSDEHAGLGLSLVAALASLLRMRIGFAQDPGGTFRASLTGGHPIPARAS